MATVSDNPIPGIGAGILMPKFNHRFKVTFLDDVGDPLPGGEVLTSQVIAIAGVYDRRDAMSSGNGDFVLRVEDDASNAVMSAIVPLIDNSTPFTVVVSMLDGNGAVASEEWYSNCKLVQIAHSDRNYAPKPQPAITVSIPDWVGDVIDALSEDPKIRSLVELLNGARLVLKGTEDTVYAASTKSLLIRYSSVKYKLNKVE